MGSPVSVVVAEIVMQHVEERALETCRQTIPLWLRYVDDTFTAIHKDEIDTFHDYQRNRRKWKTSFSRLFGKPRQQRTTDDSVQKTDAYRQITLRIILQPDFTQSHDYRGVHADVIVYIFAHLHTTLPSEENLLGIYRLQAAKELVKVNTWLKF